jgi:hypothetical protein
MYTMSYLIPAVSGIFQIAMGELSDDDRSFYQDYLSHHQRDKCFGILETHDGKHYELIEIGGYDDVLDDLAKSIADEAEEASVIDCKGEGATRLEKLINDERSFNNAVHCYGRYNDLVIYATNSNDLLQVSYQAT